MKKSRKILSIILIIIITGIGYVVYNQFFSPKAQAINKVKSRLLDPESAKFKDVTVKNDVVCGYVNAKNSFGGYAGVSFPESGPFESREKPLLLRYEKGTI